MPGAPEMTGTANTWTRSPPARGSTDSTPTPVLTNLWTTDLYPQATLEAEAQGPVSRYTEFLDNVRGAA